MTREEGKEAVNISTLNAEAVAGLLALASLPVLVGLLVYLWLFRPKAREPRIHKH